jgi:glycosyltransferase involved in cell wall biosynthesis
MDDSTKPIISVVIPTRNRAGLLLRAVKSALEQAFKEIEVIVVVDGFDPVTAESLASVHDPRLHTIALPISVGGSEARNIGIQRARGEFVALLDDDDEWTPQKLFTQLAAARSSTYRYPVITSRLIARRPDADEIWPRRRMRDDESMSDYLFCREESIRQGEGFIQTSTLLVSRELMLVVPFRAGLPRHQDWDWLIRVAVYPGVKIICVWDTLVIYHIDAYRGSVSAGRSAGPSTDWINGNALVTPKARAYFYATQVAVRCGSLGALLSVIRNTIRYPRAFLIAMSLALTPRSLVSQLRTKGVVNHA